MSGFDFLLALEEIKFVVLWVPFSTLSVPFRHIREAKLNFGFWPSLAPVGARGGGETAGTGKVSLEEVPPSQLSGPGSYHYSVRDIRARREAMAQKAYGLKGDTSKRGHSS